MTSPLQTEPRDARRATLNGVQADINARLESVLEVAPSDAAAELKMRKTKKGYQGLLKICSKQGKFVGGYESQEFSDVVERIFSEVHAQIRRWKRQRQTAVDEN